MVLDLLQGGFPEPAQWQHAAGGSFGNLTHSLSRPPVQLIANGPDSQKPWV